MKELLQRQNFLLQKCSHSIKSNYSYETIRVSLLHILSEMTEYIYGYVEKSVDILLAYVKLLIYPIVRVTQDLAQIGAYIQDAIQQTEKIHTLSTVLTNVTQIPEALNINNSVQASRQPGSLPGIPSYTFLGIPFRPGKGKISVFTRTRQAYRNTMIQMLDPFTSACASMLSIDSKKQPAITESDEHPKHGHIPEYITYLPLAMYAVDFRTDKILYFNHHFCSIWGIESMEKQLSEGNFKHSSLLPYLLQSVVNREIFHTHAQQESHTIEDEITFHDQKTIRRISTTYNKDNLQQILYLFEDITQRKAKENALIHAKQEAEVAASAKQQFLSAMSHEIRTPMNAVIGMTHLLLQENPKPEQVDNLKTLKFSSDNLLVLINDILDLSKIEAGKMIFEETDFDLKDLIYNIKNSLNYKVEEKGIKTKIRLDPKLPPVMVGDPVRLSQVLNNLMSNAIKFTEKGNVNIDVMLESEDKDSLKINFAVIDTGIGISKDKLDYIFESFTQETTDITRRFGGTGLGLAITKRLLELQNSQIYVESSIGKGSVFYFTLAFKRSLKKYIVEAHEAVNYADVDLAHVRLLLVEDNEINQLVATKFLKQLNIKPDCASNGKLALEKVKNKDYDIILMDVQMPEMGGYEATRAIRSLGGKNAQIPIIAVTAGVIFDTHTRAMAAGITDFTAKPINPNELYQKILKYIQADKNSKEMKNNNQTPPKEGKPARKLQLNYTNLLDICADDIEAQDQMLHLAIHSFTQFKGNYETALSSKNMVLLDSSAHYMKTLFYMLNDQELIQEVNNGKILITNEVTTPHQIEISISKVIHICDHIIYDLNQILFKKISA